MEGLVVPTPSRGRIVWVEIVDPQGKSPKCRPAAILSTPEQIAKNEELRVVAISTQLDAAPAEACVPLPWRRDGKAQPGLTQPSVAVCNWLVEIHANEIKGFAGTIPSKALIEILKKIRGA
jgi:mRNA-degrading endonuclease toxin of MazEF toxin-antitoxin module